MSMTCPDAQLEQKENPRQEDINRLFDLDNALSDLSRCMREHEKAFPEAARNKVQEAIDYMELAIHQLDTKDDWE